MIYRILCAVLLAVIAVLGYHAYSSLQDRLQDVTQALEQEVRQRERVEKLTIALQTAEAERRKALSEYERELAKEPSSVLSDTVPDSVLRGLRSVAPARGAD